MTHEAMPGSWDVRKAAAVDLGNRNQRLQGLTLFRNSKYFLAIKGVCYRKVLLLLRLVGCLRSQVSCLRLFSACQFIIIDMKKYSAICCILAVASTLIGGVTTSCNSSYDVNEYTYVYSSTAVTGFSLSADDRILHNLDSVFFSIDLEKGEIYNAQPLPYGTDISRMVVNIETDECSATDILFKTKNGSDTTVNYLTNATDSINFAKGPVTIHVASYDGTAGRNYKAWINVYEQPVDSIYWTDMGRIPSSISGLRQQKTIEAAGKYFMLASNNTAYSLAVTEDPFDKTSWLSGNVEFGAIAPVVNSFTGTTDGKLYILDQNGILYVSDDEGQTWTECDGVKMDNIYGAFGDKVVGCVADDEGKILTRVYPGSAEATAAPTDLPVSGTSEMVCMTVRWGVEPQGYIVGGRKADGTLSGDTWGFDGQKWACISNGTLAAAEGRTIFPYTFNETDTTTWRTTEREVLVAMGGKLADNTLVKSVYFSNDMGMHWFEADKLKQLPPVVKPRHSASAVVAKHEINASRAVRPITEWDAPYIYLSGGYDVNGTFLPDMWQGVLDYLTIKPLQ